MYARDEARIATPIGMFRIHGDEERLTGIAIEAEGGPTSRPTATMVRDAADQIEAWFASERKTFDLALEPLSTPRSRQLRDGLIAVGHSETIGYGALARRLGSSARAIGQLCARNPFPLVVPCHRVLGAGGMLGQYSAGAGPATKAWLLDFERKREEEP